METAKAICLSYVLSLAAGWLSRKFLFGHLSADNKAALFILLATVLTTTVIFCTLGLQRWRSGQLSPMEKRLLVVSLIMFVVMFLAGWFSDIG